MDEAQVYRKALELLATDLGTALVEKRIAQSQALLLQEEVQRTATPDVDFGEAIDVD